MKSLLGIFFLVLTFNVFACIPSTDREYEIWQQAIEQHQDVFIGKVLAVQKSKPIESKKVHYYYFEPIKVYKGKVSSNQSYAIIKQGYSLNFQVGDFVLAFANEKRILTVNQLCGWNSSNLGKLTVQELEDNINDRRASHAVDSGLLQELEWAERYLVNRIEGSNNASYSELLQRVRLAKKHYFNTAPKQKTDN